MTPVMILSDGYLNASEPWKIPNFDSLKSFRVNHYDDPKDFKPSIRDKNTKQGFGRSLAPCDGASNGGIEKSFETGDIYDPANHQKMTELRRKRLLRLPMTYLFRRLVGESEGKLAVLGWGSTYGAIHQAVKRAVADGMQVSHIHVRYLSPMPSNLCEFCQNLIQFWFREMNTGQFIKMIRSEF